MIRRFKKYYNINNEEVVPPPPPEGECYTFTLEALLDFDVTFNFLRCSGGGSETVGINVPGNSSLTICAREVFPPAVASNKWAIYTGDICGNTACTSYTLLVDQSDINKSDDGRVYWDYIDCLTKEVRTRSHSSPGAYSRCIKNDTAPIVYIYNNGEINVSLESTLIANGSC